MKKTISGILFLSAFFIVNCSIPIPVTQPLPVSTIQGGGLLGSALPVQNFNLPIVSGSQQLPPGAKAIHLKVLAIRSVLNDPSDQTDSALENDSIVEQCPAGRAQLGFIDSVTIKIKHQGEGDSKAVTLATYTKPASGAEPCGFHMQTADVNIKDYVSDYALVPEVSGKAPKEDVQIAGYIELIDDEGV
jgi:hypothetical protein